ncbi:hypothetical protein RND81_10G237300 [Saponaria officinalis]|uniref:DNA-directed RNA polymerase n=1 Tax=Saponaria officinalis TaxID=3572 RepID=A0AAW1I5U0_SAPOF
MPVSMKIQPINAVEVEPNSSAAAVVVKPVVKSRLKRLFRISAAEKEETPPSTEMFEPSSVCLAKMVQNFIEENNDKHHSRNRCNCFNANGSDGSDGETDAVSATAADVTGFLKNLVASASVNERKVVADTARVVAEMSKACKRKDELKKLVVEGLMAVGYDAAICKSKWEKSPSFPAGEYEYLDVIIGEERLIVDIGFRSEFEVARSTKTYKSILQTIPNIFVGKSDRLSKIICVLSEATKQSLKKKGMHIPPWRKADYVLAKWLSPPTRLVTNSVTVTATPPPSPTVSVFPSPKSPTLAALATVLAETQLNSDGSEADSGSSHSETVFEMSESSSEEDVKISPKKSLKMVTGLTSIIENKS